MRGLRVGGCSSLFDKNPFHSYSFLRKIIGFTEQLGNEAVAKFNLCFQSQKRKQEFTLVRGRTRINGKGGNLCK